MADPTISTESVKYTLDGASVVAMRRDLPTSDGVKSQWVFNVATTLAGVGIPLTGAYTEKVVDSEEERDAVGKDLVRIIGGYQQALQDAREDFQDALADYFPAPAAPTPQVVTQ